MSTSLLGPHKLEPLCTWKKRRGERRRGEEGEKEEGAIIFGVRTPVYACWRAHNSIIFNRITHYTLLRFVEENWLIEGPHGKPDSAS